MTPVDPFTYAGPTTSSGHVDVPRDHLGRYLLPDPDDPSKKHPSWTRVTTFAKTLSDSFALSLWAQRMAIKGVATRPDLFALAAATPLDDKKTLNSIVDAAKEAAGAGAAASLGTALHAFTEQVDRGDHPDIPEPWSEDVRAYRRALKSAGMEIVPEFIERVVVVPLLGVAGTFDRILRLKDGRLVIADVKTGKDLQYGWLDIAVQLSLYAHAEWIYDLETGTYEPMPEVAQDIAVVMHLPVGKAECTLYEVDIARGWEAALLCEEVRGWRKVKGLATPILETSSGTTTPLSINERLEAADTVEDLREVWEASLVAGTWTDASMAILRARLAEVKQPA